MNDKCPLKAKKWLSYAKSNLCDLNRFRFFMDLGGGEEGDNPNAHIKQLKVTSKW